MSSDHTLRIASLLDLTEVDHPDQSASDGASLKPLLYQEEFNQGKPRSLVFHYPHYYRGTTPVSALRKGDLKLLQYYTPEGLRFELYDLANDPTESHDLSAQRGKIVQDMSSELTSSLWEMSANFPSRNPDYPAKD